MNLSQHTNVTTKCGKSISIQLLDSSHIQALIHFHNSLSDKSRQFFFPHAYDEVSIKKYIKRNKLKQDLIYVALYEQTIIAYFFLWNFNQSNPTLGIGIADEYQGKGLAKSFINKLITEAKLKNIKYISLTTVLSNEKAFHLYQKCGFKYIKDVDNRAGDGRIVKEKYMVLNL